MGVGMHGYSRDTMKRYSDRILVCDLKALFFREERSKRSGDGHGEEKEEKKEELGKFEMDMEKSEKVEESAWMESNIRLPERCNLVGVVLVKKHKIHIFGGFDGRKSLHQHLVYDVRDIIGNLRKVEKVIEVM